MATGGTKNNPANRNNTVHCYCPDCGEKLQVVRRIDWSEAKNGGWYWSCTRCSFSEKKFPGSFHGYRHELRSKG
jgi:hypothetical protein